MNGVVDRRSGGDRMRLTSALVGSLMVVSALSASAAPLAVPVLPGIGAADRREPVDGTAAPWRSLAKVYGLTYCLLASVVLAASWLVERKRQALRELQMAREQESREPHPGRFATG